ncbi:DUF2339 domain-containing protein [bacterium]|nr:DUF2339 domain-containing protein [bacterium]MBR1620432.1 DUF2339 domain-containing protein [bacterium]
MISYMICVCLIVWLAIIQNQVSDLSANVEKIKKYFWEQKSLGLPESKEQTSSPAQMPVSEMPSESIQDVTPEPQPEQTYQESSPEPEFQAEIQESFDLQKALLGNIFNKIGAIAIIVALIIFIKLVSPYIVITPLMKIIFAYFAGLGLIGGGFHLHRKENLKNYAEVMLGTGFADLFITTFCAYTIFDFLNTPAVIAIGTVLLIVTYITADKMKTLSMLIIGLIGAYLTPFCAKAGTHAVLSYIIFINMLSVIFTMRNKSTNWVNIINLFMSMLVFLCYSYGSTMSIVYPLILWGTYIIYDVLREKDNDIDNVVCYINYGILTLFSVIIFKDAYNYLAILLGVTALCYFGLSFYSRKLENNLYRFYEYSAIVNVWLVGFFLLNTFQSAIAWSILALGITYIVQKKNAKHLNGGLIWYYSTAIVAALSAKYAGENCLITAYTPIFNIRTLLFAFPVLSMITSAFVFKKNNLKMYNLLLFSGLSLGYVYLTGEINSILSQTAKDSDMLDFNRGMINIIIGFVYALNTKRLGKTNDSKLFDIAGFIMFGISLLALMICSYFYYDSYIVLFNMKVCAFALGITTCFIFSKWDNTDIYKYLAIILGFLICHSESSQIYAQNSGMEYIISLSWVLYSGISTIAGILRNKKYLINTGIALIILSILRIFIYDLAHVEAIFKLIAFLALGLILMLVSYIYTTHKNKQN